MQNTSSALQRTLVYMYVCMYVDVYSANKPASPTFLLFTRLPFNCHIISIVEKCKQTTGTESSHNQNKCVSVARTSNRANRIPAALMNDCLAIYMHNTHTFIIYTCVENVFALVAPLHFRCSLCPSALGCGTHANAAYILTLLLTLCKRNAFLWFIS